MRQLFLHLSPEGTVRLRIGVLEQLDQIGLIFGSQQNSTSCTGSIIG